MIDDLHRVFGVASEGLDRSFQTRTLGAPRNRLTILEHRPRIGLQEPQRCVARELIGCASGPMTLQAWTRVSCSKEHALDLSAEPRACVDPRRSALVSTLRCAPKRQRTTENSDCLNRALHCSPSRPNDRELYVCRDDAASAASLHSAPKRAKPTGGPTTPRYLDPRCPTPGSAQRPSPDAPDPR